jgi:hypothetical protein
VGLERPGRTCSDEQTASIVASLSDPMQATIKQIAEQEGVSPAVAHKLLKVLREKKLVLARTLGEVTKTETRQMYEYVAHTVLSSITQADIDKAGLKDKMLSAAIATDKALLLDGQPTEILSIPQMENMDELARLLLKEAKRRGQMPILDEGSQTVTLRKQIGVGERGDPTRDASSPSDEPR